MISAIILTKNEESTIAPLCKQLSFCDEIIIIDDNSTDLTVSRASEVGCVVFSRSLDNDFARQRNFGLEKALSEWVLFIDADERVSEKLRNEILSSVEKQYEAFLIPRRDVFIGKQLNYGTWSNSYIRLARRDSGKWKRKVHEYWDVDGRVGTLNNEIVHKAHPSVAEFWEDIRRYSVLHARENNTEGKASSLYKIILWPFGKFIYSFILKRGYKDGIRGLLYASMMSAHSFISWATLYLESNKYRTQVQR